MGAIVLAPGKRDWGPLLRRGWVTEAWPDRQHDGSRYLPPLRITPDGLRAVAAAMEVFGAPEVKPDEKKLAVRRCSCELGEMPSVYCSVHKDAARVLLDEQRATEGENDRLRRRLAQIHEASELAA